MSPAAGVATLFSFDCPDLLKSAMHLSRHITKLIAAVIIYVRPQTLVFSFVIQIDSIDKTSAKLYLLHLLSATTISEPIWITSPCCLKLSSRK